MRELLGRLDERDLAIVEHAMSILDATVAAETVAAEATDPITTSRGK